MTVTPAAVSAITGADGQFVLDGIADGEQTVAFALADFADTVTVVVAGGTVRMDRTVDWALRYADLVTVTGALRRRERLVEAPASANVVPAAVIARDGGHGQLPKLLEAAPGVEVIQSGVFDFNLNMRGFNRALNRRVLVLIDGRDPGGVLLGAQEWAAYAVPLDDIAQVEVINGPGSLFTAQTRSTEWSASSRRIPGSIRAAAFLPRSANEQLPACRGCMPMCSGMTGRTESAARP